MPSSHWVSVCRVCVETTYYTEVHATFPWHVFNKKQTLIEAAIRSKCSSEVWQFFPHPAIVLLQISLITLFPAWEKMHVPVLLYRHQEEKHLGLCMCDFEREKMREGKTLICVTRNLSLTEKQDTGGLLKTPAAKSSTLFTVVQLLHLISTVCYICSSIYCVEKVLTCSTSANMLTAFYLK